MRSALPNTISPLVPRSTRAVSPCCSPASGWRAHPPGRRCRRSPPDRAGSAPAGPRGASSRAPPPGTPGGRVGARFERDPRQRAHVEAAEEVVHHRVAHHRHRRRGASPRARRWRPADCTSSPTPLPHQSLVSLARPFSSSAYSVRFMMSLPYAAWGLSAVWTASTWPDLEVQELGHQGGGAQVHGHAEARPGLEVEGRVVDQDGRAELLHLQGDRGLRAAAASQPPALLQLLRGEDRLLVGRGGKSPPHHLDATASAAPAPAAGELHPVGVEDVAQRGSALDLDAAAERSAARSRRGRSCRRSSPHSCRRRSPA